MMSREQWPGNWWDTGWAETYNVFFFSPFSLLPEKVVEKRYFCTGYTVYLYLLSREMIYKWNTIYQSNIDLFCCEQHASWVTGTHSTTHEPPCTLSIRISNFGEQSGSICHGGRRARSCLLFICYVSTFWVFHTSMPHCVSVGSSPRCGPPVIQLTVQAFSWRVVRVQFLLFVAFGYSNSYHFTNQVNR